MAFGIWDGIITACVAHDAAKAVMHIASSREYRERAAMANQLKIEELRSGNCLDADGYGGQKELVFNVPSEETILQYISSKEMPLNKFVGNPRAVTRYREACFDALTKDNRDASDHQFAVIGPASSGKTFLVKLFAQSLGLPYVEVDPGAIRSVTDLHQAIAKVCSETETPDGETLELKYVGFRRYSYPPMVVFIDEVHNLKSSVVQGLLKATEPNDRTMTTEDGVVIDTSRVCWQIATTDRGDLFDAFDTRFEKVDLNPYGISERTEIVKLAMPEIPDEVAEMAAFFGSIPRESIPFAKSMLLKRKMYSDLSWEDIALTVADDKGIDRYGMSFKRLDVLKALVDGPVASARLAVILRVKDAELKKFIMPPLLNGSVGISEEPCVSISSKGYEITDAGEFELRVRDII